MLCWCLKEKSDITDYEHQFVSSELKKSARYEGTLLAQILHMDGARFNTNTGKP